MFSMSEMPYQEMNGATSALDLQQMYKDMHGEYH